MGLLLALAVPASGQDTGDAIRFVSWNVTWFGHAGFPPADDALQLENVLSVLQGIGADVIALQEVASATAFARLVERLGPPHAGVLGTTGGDQRLAIVYRADRVVMADVSDDVLSDDAHDFGGRVPLIAQLETRGPLPTARFLLVVVHLKAFGDSASYERRLRSLERLAAYLDAQTTTTNVIVAGDFNDRTVTSTADGRTSPLRALQGRRMRYQVLSAALEAEGQFSYCATPSCESGTMLDHIVVSQTVGSWNPVVQTVDSVLHRVPFYVTTTSDHLPLSLVVPLQRPGDPPHRPIIEAVYPNPARDAVMLEVVPGEPVRLEVIDMLGRSMIWNRPHLVAGSSVDVPLHALSPGVYVLRVHRDGEVDQRVFVRGR